MCRPRTLYTDAVDCGSNHEHVHPCVSECTESSNFETDLMFKDSSFAVSMNDLFMIAREPVNETPNNSMKLSCLIAIPFHQIENINFNQNK